MNLAIIQALALGVTPFDVSGHTVVDLKVNHPFFSGVMVSPREDADISAVVQGTFKALDRSFMWICDEKIEGATMVFPFPEMTMNLDSLVEPKASPAEFTIIDSQDLSEWKSVVGPNYDFEGDDIDSFADLYKGKKGFYHIVAKIDDIVVGAGTLQVHGDIAVLHNISTLKVARGKGVGSRMAFELLLHAKQLGCKRSMIHGSEKAEKLYQRLGYKTQKVAYANFFKKT